MDSEQIRFRRFIRNKTTGQYLRLDGSWTPHLEEACEFKNALAMLDCCHVFGLMRGIQVLIKPYVPTMPEVIADLF